MLPFIAANARTPDASAVVALRSSDCCSVMPRFNMSSNVKLLSCFHTVSSVGQWSAFALKCEKKSCFFSSSAMITPYKRNFSSAFLMRST